MPEGAGTPAFALAAAACIAPLGDIAPASLAVHAGGVAWATGNCDSHSGSLSDPNQPCVDSDGDGLPDSSDPCPRNPNPFCNTIYVYGDRGHVLPVTCSDGTRVAVVDECPHHYTATGGDNTANRIRGDSEGRNGGGGGGGDSGRSGNPQPPQTPGASIAADKNFVVACADKARRAGPPHVFSDVRRMGVVNVSYGDAGTGLNGNPALGLATWKRSTVDITMDYKDISDYTKKAGKNYWQQFAETLLHEYHHAYDMWACRCGDPDVQQGMTRQEYEDQTQLKAVRDHWSLFKQENAGCLPD